MFYAIRMKTDEEARACKAKAKFDAGKEAQRSEYVGKEARRFEVRQPVGSQQGHMRTIATALILASALWLNPSVAAQDDPIACLDLKIQRAYELNHDGDHYPAAIVAVTNGCTNAVDKVVVECAWTEAGNVVAAQSNTLSNLGTGQIAILLTSSERSGLPRGTKPNCRISLVNY